METSGSASVVEAADPNKRVLAMPSVAEPDVSTFSFGASADGALVDGAPLCPGASISTNTSPTFATVPSGTITFLTVPVNRDS